MTEQFKKVRDRIITANCKEQHTFKLKITSENYGKEIAELKEFINNDKRFKLRRFEIIEMDYLELSVEWRGLEYGKYYIY